MTTYFISDLHLCAERPETTALFLKFLQTEAVNADALYIMGDFFESWIGEDIADNHDLEILNAIRQFNQKTKKPVYFMPGNRDFLINEALAARFGGIYLRDPTIIQLYGKKVLLMHGDSLCTADIAYQCYRRFVQHPLIQKTFLWLPAFLRRKIAQALRKKTFSPAKARRMAPQYWDVTEQSVNDAFRQYNTQILIHGHTHKPGIHDTTLDQIPVKRIVLGDWGKEAIILAFRQEGLALQAIS